MQGFFVLHYAADYFPVRFCLAFFFLAAARFLAFFDLALGLSPWAPFAACFFLSFGPDLSLRDGLSSRRAILSG